VNKQIDNIMAACASLA